MQGSGGMDSDMKVIFSAVSDPGFLQVAAPTPPGGGGGGKHTILPNLITTELTNW